MFNASAAKAARLLNGDGLDKYVYNAQDGHGMGGFFSPIFKAIIPLVKTIGRTLFAAVKPASRAVAGAAIKGMATSALTSLADKTIQSVKRKRKSKHLTSSRSKRLAI